MRTPNDKQFSTNCSGMLPDKPLLDKSKTSKRLILLIEEGMLPSKSFLDRFKNTNLGKHAPISVGI
jgi:hypothetical protein